MQSSRLSSLTSYHCQEVSPNTGLHTVFDLPNFSSHPENCRYKHQGANQAVGASGFMFSRRPLRGCSHAGFMHEACPTALLLVRLHFGCEESGEGKKKHRAVCCWVPHPCFPRRYGRGSRPLPTPSRPGGESFPHACLPGSFSFSQAGGDTSQSILEACAALVPGG